MFVEDQNSIIYALVARQDLSSVVVLVDATAQIKKKKVNSALYIFFILYDINCHVEKLQLTGNFINLIIQCLPKFTKKEGKVTQITMWRLTIKMLAFMLTSLSFDAQYFTSF